MWPSEMKTSPFGAITTLVGWVKASGGFPATPGFPERQQDLAVRTELDDDVALFLFSRELREFPLVCGSLIGHPHVAVPIHIDLVGENEHAGAKAFHQVAG